MACVVRSTFSSSVTGIEQYKLYVQDMRFTFLSLSFVLLEPIYHAQKTQVTCLDLIWPLLYSSIKSVVELGLQWLQGIDYPNTKFKKT